MPDSHGLPVHNVLPVVHSGQLADRLEQCINVLYQWHKETPNSHTTSLDNLNVLLARAYAFRTHAKVIAAYYGCHPDMHTYTVDHQAVAHLIEEFCALIEEEAWQST